MFDDALAEQILACEDIERKEVTEWGVTFDLCTLGGEDRDAFEASMSDGKRRNVANLRARLVSLCARNKEGARIFKPDLVAKLGKKSSKKLDRLFEICLDLNGMNKKDVEEAEKNSERTPADSST